MSLLQKINLGTPPTGVDGDAVRTAFTKDNANVDVLNAQTALTTSGATITTPTALTVAHVGKRVNISLASPGTINLPSASTCLVDNVTLLRNIGTTVVTLAITTGSGDTVALSKLNPGESALLDTDGVHTWRVLMRGRTNSDNELVNGNLVQGTGTQKAILSSGFVYSSNTGGTAAADKYAEMYHDGTTSGVAVSNGTGDSFGNLISTTTTLKPAGMAQIFGRNVPVVSAFFSGHSGSLGAATVMGCTVTYLSVGRLRISLNTPFAFTNHMLIVGGTAVSNGTNFCVPAIMGNAGDGTFVDIGSQPTGTGFGTAVEMQLSLLVVKVR